jgi:hypothetical protein
MKSLLQSIIILFLLLVVAGTASAQITVAPTRVVLSGREKSQEITIRNPTAEPLEIEASFGFKLLRSDSLGNLFLDSTAHGPEESARSCRDWLKMFPKKFVLAPGSTRVVRVVATPPVDIEDGEYWGRVRVSGNPMETPKPLSLRDSTVIGTNVTVILALEIPVMLRKGSIETGVAIDGATGVRDSAGPVVFLDLKRTGNSAYRGTAFSTLRRADGSEIPGVANTPFTIEFALRAPIRLPQLPDGAYRLETEIKSVRQGTAADVTLPAPTVNGRYDVVVAGKDVRVTPVE